MVTRHKHRREFSRITLLEKNVVHKKYRPGVLRVAIAYPSTYQVGMSSLSIHLLYHYLNSLDFVIAERVFMEGTGPYRSIESGTPLRDFDLILFSVHYELDYVNIVRMLERSGIPPLRKHRKDNKYPTIAVGGPCVTANPEPLADIVDVVFIGEAEPILESFLEEVLVREGVRDIDIEGVYITERKPEVLRKVVAKPLEQYDYPTRQIVTLEAPEEYMPVFGKAFYLEVSRGCPFLCCFCMETLVQFPFRIRSFECIKKVIEEGLEHCPVDKIVVISLAYQSYPYAKDLIEYVLNNFDIEISLPSMRADLLDDDMLELMVRANQHTLTIAPETSERLRVRLGKDFTDSDVLDVAYRAKRHGVRELKMYFIVGLPEESKDDIDSVLRLIHEVKKSTGLELYVSINPWVRKPHTPFQYAVPEPIEQVSSKLDYLAENCGARHVVYDPYLAYAQMFLALGDRSLAEVLIEAARMKESNLSRSLWKKIFNKYSNLFKRVVFRQLCSIEDAPWGFIDIGLRAETIRRKWEMYISG